MKREAKPKQPIVGISLEPWGLAEMKEICGGDQPAPGTCRVCARELGIVCERHLD